MIKVLVVEDSPVVREFLVHVLSSDPGILVVGTAKDGEDALEAVERWKPDVITMDIHMPKLNGFEATRRIMESHPTPIVVVSGSWDRREVAMTFHAIEAGALAAIPRPSGISHPRHADSAAELVSTVKLMSEVKVVRRWTRRSRSQVAPGEPRADLTRLRRPPAQIKLAAVGASTGGPVALQTILSTLPRDFPVPILIVQHMAAGFTEGFVEWLTGKSNLPVCVAAQRELALPGKAYVAPDGFQMKVDVGGNIALTQDEPENGLRPSVSYLFRSVADVYGRNAAGVLLTGMGKDGAVELKKMNDAGAVTIAQDEESSVVHGMPGEAIQLGAATYVLPPERIAAALTNLVRNLGNDPWTIKEEK
ncbi:MAG: chemotaxis response regulator protein-glutamate methylesterase [Acidobacteria bacterium]|nr:chemotaxis response regulator protein-glutamate methylesterase [Acidobacteriota bacterium]